MVKQVKPVIAIFTCISLYNICEYGIILSTIVKYIMTFTRYSVLLITIKCLKLSLFKLKP